MKVIVEAVNLRKVYMLGIVIMVTHDQRLAAEAKRPVHMLDGLIVDEKVNWA
ncbi:hypothetical protein KEJ32_05215 [Candidatus Bathyarchaeota archaeon]|nr:hypothetical protein [Candidatus Bathyarchaeota archaeon]